MKTKLQGMQEEINTINNAPREVEGKEKFFKTEKETKIVGQINAPRFISNLCIFINHMGKTA